MFDPAMAEFQTEMRAGPRPRRASTRRAEQVDNLSAPGAQRLCQMIKRYWNAAGFDNIRTEIVSCTGARRETGVRRQVKSEERTAAGRGRPLWPRVKNR